MTLAKKLYKENPSVWSSIELCRSAIRCLRGTNGTKLRDHASDKRFFTPPKTSTTWYIPKSDAKEREVFTIPKGVTRLGILSDIHLPYHDEKALGAAVSYLKQMKVNGLLLNGDTLDFYGLSTHEKDPRKRKFKDEIECFREFIYWIKQELDCPIYFKVGNHEFRYERWMMLKAPELLDIANFKFSEFLEFGKHGIIEIGSKTKIKAGKFTIYHGHEFRGSGGVNPARWLSLKAKIPAMVGHFHKSSEHVWRDSNDNTYGCYSTGCLCELNPDYLPENEWNHGFAYMDIEPNGDYVVHNKKIVNGKVY
jgi:predicted phosphodiesterase